MGCHYGFNYVNKTFIVEKHYDILSIHTQKYKDIIEDITTPEPVSMEDELLQFALDESIK